MELRQINADLPQVKDQVDAISTIGQACELFYSAQKRLIRIVDMVDNLDLEFATAEEIKSLENTLILNATNLYCKAVAAHECSRAVSAGVNMTTLKDISVEMPKLEDKLDALETIEKSAGLLNNASNYLVEALKIIQDFDFAKSTEQELEDFDKTLMDNAANILPRALVADEFALVVSNGIRKMKLVLIKRSGQQDVEIVTKAEQDKLKEAQWEKDRMRFRKEVLDKDAVIGNN